MPNIAQQPATVHRRLDCGIELAALPLAGRRTVSLDMRFLVGFANEPRDKLGLNRTIEQVVSKGTEKRTGKELSDAFDELGASWSSWAGREATGYQFTCLPEFVDRALELHAEFLRCPTFPEDAVQVANENSIKEITNLQDDPDELSADLFNRQVYGPILGRQVLGEKDTLRTITRADVQQYWREFYQAGRMLVSVAGAFDSEKIAAKLEELFGGFGSPEQAGRQPFPYEFEPKVTHHEKDLEQEHIGICYLGAPLSDPMRYAQKVAIAVLSGGMSARLFTELREKQGLVYWVTAHTEHPREIGIVYLGASTTPKRSRKTYDTLLREVDRLSEDLEEVELRRAITGIVAKARTRGDITRSRCGEIMEDLFHHGEVIPREEKIAKIEAVSVADVKEYLARFPRDRLSVLTLGPERITD